MNKIISVILSVITALSGLFMTPAAEIPSYIENINEKSVYQITENTGLIKDTVLVIFEEDASVFEKLSVFAKTGGVCVGKISDLNLYILKTDGMDSEDMDKLCRNLTSLDSVTLASLCPAKKLTEQYTPDDPFMDKRGYGTNDWDDENPEGNNWHIEAVDARSAWGYKSLFTHINIGVVDGGFDTEHEELEGKITFPSKLEEWRNRPNHHGTHVAGIIAAGQDNGVGLSGICPDSTLICVDWSPSTNQLWLADLSVLQALGKVVKAGAKVVNFSVGNSSSMGDDKYEFPSFVPNLDGMLYSYAVGSLLQKGYDFVVVQSAGNGNGESHAVDASQNGLFSSINENNAFLPFSDVEIEDVLDRIIIVGSAEVGENGFVQSSSSNIGDRVDICAPGKGIYSSTKDDTYLTKSGTSMAAPVVTGVASLVWSVNAELSGADVKKIVCENTCDEVLPSDERHYDFLNYKAYPMVNAKLAVEEALRQTGEFYDVSIISKPKTEVTFENESGDAFIFETDSEGKLTCVLRKGTYTVKAENTVTEITVSCDMEIFM